MRRITSSKSQMSNITILRQQVGTGAKSETECKGTGGNKHEPYGKIFTMH